MDKQTEDEFIAVYEDGVAKRVAREAYRAIYPGGMNTNGPVLVNIEASRLLRILARWKRPEPVITTADLPPLAEHLAAIDRVSEELRAAQETGVHPFFEQEPCGTGALPSADLLIEKAAQEPDPHTLPVDDVRCESRDGSEIP